MEPTNQDLNETDLKQDTLKPDDNEKEDKKDAPVVIDKEYDRANEVLNSGILEGYKYILKNLSKSGMPKGNLFEYASVKMTQFEAKWKNEQRRIERFKSKFDHLKAKKKDYTKSLMLLANKDGGQGKKSKKFAKKTDITGSTEILLGLKNHNIDRKDQDAVDASPKSRLSKLDKKKADKSPANKKKKHDKEVEEND